MSERFDTPSHRHGSRTIDHLKVDARTAVVSVKGDLDLWSAPQLKRALCELLESGQDRLVLDLGRVPFMDSTALGVMVGIQRRLGVEQRLAIAEPRAEVLRIFELTGAGAALLIFPTREAAVRYVTRDGTEDASAPPLAADAALLLGIASTAMPFAQSTEDQAERWLRALRGHGEAGAVLASLGVREAPDARLDGDTPGRPLSLGDRDAVAAVTKRASRIASGRGAAKLASTDLLRAVMHVYGATFDRVLSAHGVDIDELVARLALCSSLLPTADQAAR